MERSSGWRPTGGRLNFTRFLTYGVSECHHGHGSGSGTGPVEHVVEEGRFSFFYCSVYQVEILDEGSLRSESFPGEGRVVGGAS